MLVAFVVFLAPCPLAQRDGTLRGVVISTASSLPIPNAEATMTGMGYTFHAVSDSQGVFYMYNVPEGNYTITITAAGYVTYIYSPLQTWEDRR
ncbi:MAG TPA: carboxypeptidase-like regulatory domain-containing protein [Candidatus Hydrogenedentes bacterium]|nr:carboxypeptidase-like regulatory domain-containing protein [Candidatus Hydrogenedentota bacterium]